MKPKFQFVHFGLWPACKTNVIPMRLGCALQCTLSSSRLREANHLQSAKSLKIELKTSIAIFLYRGVNQGLVNLINRLIIFTLVISRSLRLYESQTVRVITGKRRRRAVYLCRSDHMCVPRSDLKGSQVRQQEPKGSGAVLRDTLTFDLYSIILCCGGRHKRKTHSDLIGWDWSCSAALKPPGSLIFVGMENQEIQRKWETDFMGWKWRTSQGSSN